MITRWWFMTGSLLLLLTGCASAPPAPPVASSLSPNERTCRFLGEAARTMANNRDAGLSMVDVLGRAASTNIGPQMYGILQDAAVYAYDRPQLSPAMIQQTREARCLEVLNAQGS